MNTTKAIKNLLEIVNDLQKTYPNKKFTLDGRLVGDIGEILVQENYDIKLFDKIVEKYDGEDSKKRKVQIKATFNDKLTFPCEEKKVPEFYIGIKIFQDGTFEEVFNGNGKLIWELVKDRKKPSNGQFSISLAALRKQNEKVKKSERIQRKK